MGKFQLNKEGEDPIKIYEDTFKVANDTIETHLDKLGKQPNPISESKASEGEFKCPKCKFETDDDDAWSYHMQDHDEGDSAVSDFMKYEMESKASEDVTFGQDNVWSMMTTQQREDAFNRVGLSGIHFNEDDESNWAKYNYGDIEWYGLTPKMQDQLNKWGIGESKASGMKHEWESVESIASEGNTNRDSDGKFATGNTLVYTQGKGKLTSTVKDGDSDVLKQWIKDQEDNPEQADQIRAVKKLLEDRGE